MTTGRTTYAAALELLRRAQDSDGDGLVDGGATQALLTGARTPRAYVLLHGFTNAPAQFSELGRRLHATGANVILPRLPRHGLVDRLSTIPAGLTTQELTALADSAVDIAVGLGEKVTLVGLSAGGALAAWLASRRADVDLAVLLAPLFGLKIVRPWMLDLTIWLTLRTPDRYVWWDPQAKDRGIGPPHAYPGFSTRALANALLVGRSVVRAARRAAPKARLLIVTAPGDLAVDNHATYALAQRWRARGAFVDTYEFDPALNLQHDFIDPTQPDQQIEVVYPILLDLIARAEQR